MNANADGRIFVEHAAKGKFEAPETLRRDAREALIGNLANRNRTAVDALHSRLACDLPYYGARVQAFAPPVADWPLMLRIHARTARRVEDRWSVRMPDAIVERVSPGEGGVDRLGAVEAAVMRRDNILIAGRPAAGKTTFLSDLLLETAIARPHERLVTIEDRPELHASSPDSLSLVARVQQAAPDDTRYEYDFPAVLADALRTDFDALVWGEIRDGESARGLLLAANVGVKGLMATIHADSALDTLQRVEDLLRVAGVPPIRRMISRFVQTIVFLEMTPDRSTRYVGEVMRVQGVDENDDYVLDSTGG
ncbi:MAG: ATPase, T2SS/T4P/T4SS family [Vulcanimicrobiaceae bacterium]